MRRFEEYRAAVMVEVDEQNEQAKKAKDEASVKTSEKSDKAKATNALLGEQLLQYEKAKEELRSGLEFALKFDFVGGGAIEIAGSDLTGAKMDLKRISDAIENGIERFPIRVR